MARLRARGTIERMQRGATGWGWTDEAQQPGRGIVALVGRPNVGKSTLFNRLVGRRHSITDDLPGLTRDRIYGMTDWQGRVFTVVDTAGLVTNSQEPDVLMKAMQTQAQRVLRDADVLCLLVDGKDGMTKDDEEIMDIVRKLRKPLILVVNKVENGRGELTEWYRFGLDTVVSISGLHGTGTGDLLDEVVKLLPEEPASVAHEAGPVECAVALIGRPNVGKSSMLNALVGDDRALVSSVPGTTRDAVDTLVNVEGKLIRLVDTAGMRRHGVVSSSAEQYSILRSLRALQHCDVAVVMIDGAEGVVAQDRHIAGYAVDAGKGVVLVVNKWDLLDRELREDPATLNGLKAAFDFIPGIPVIAASVLEGRNLVKVLIAAQEVAAERRTHVPTPVLNNLVRKAVMEHPPRMNRGKRLKILYAVQADTPAPTVVLFVNDPELAHFSYLRYLENRVRDVYPFHGTRINFTVRARHEEK